MKKVFIMAAFALSSATMFAQQAVGTRSIIPKVGVNIANVTEWNGDPRIGLVAGAEVEFPGTDIISITVGALYSMQGMKSTTEGITTTAKIDYVNIPLLANLYVVKGLAVKLGIQPAFKVNSKYEVNGIEDPKMTISNIDLSIPVGISYEYKNFVLDARYNWGFLNFATTVGKNSVFQIMLGYKIPFRK